MLRLDVRRLTRLLAPVAAIAAVLVAFPAAASRPAPTGPDPVAAPVAPFSFGVAMPGVPGDLAQLRDLTAALGRAPQLVMWYAAWSDGSTFPAAAAAQVAATGAVPAVTWEPWDPARGADQPTYALKRIAAGAFDTYVTAWARSVRAYGQPVVLRFAHEMNGSWYPWAAQANGNTAADYVAAWRHVRGVFTKQKVTNVTWSWSPNVPYTGSTALGSLYPGDAYVDQVALDGYNWATLQPGSTWTSFWDVFGPGVAQLQALTTRPIHLGEVGCPEAGGDKAAWVGDMFATLEAHPEVRGLTWFDFAKEADWRIDSSAASLEAFRAGLA